MESVSLSGGETLKVLSHALHQSPAGPGVSIHSSDSAEPPAMMNPSKTNQPHPMLLILYLDSTDLVFKACSTTATGNTTRGSFPDTLKVDSEHISHLKTRNLHQQSRCNDAQLTGFNMHRDFFQHLQLRRLTALSPARPPNEKQKQQTFKCIQVQVV